jgi:acetylornithine deacetylase/succinyl-diaminopimelate desuccinylase-like protein
VIVLEPTGQALLPAACGRDCVRVTLRGRGAQSGWRGAALPAPDVNAVEFAVRFVTAVQQLERDWTTRKPPHPLLPPGLNTIQPGAMLCGVGMGANGLPEVLTDPTSTPDVAVVDFELKFLPNEDPGEVRQEFENFVHAFAQQDSWLRAHPPDVRWDLYGLQVPPLNTPTDHPLCAAVIDSRAARKLPTEIKGFVGFCDAAHYAGAGIPAVIFGPGGGGLRAADEYVDLDSLRAVAKTLAAVAVRWCGVK